MLAMFQSNQEISKTHIRNSWQCAQIRTELDIWKGILAFHIKDLNSRPFSWLLILAWILILERSLACLVQCLFSFHTANCTSVQGVSKITMRKNLHQNWKLTGRMFPLRWLESAWSCSFFFPRRGCIDFTTVNTTQHLKSNFWYVPSPQDNTRPGVCNTCPGVCNTCLGVCICQYTS